jgi:hypothetical protein
VNAIVCNAIRARRLLRFIYEGYERLLEPHLYGINTQNHEMLSGYLVGGWSATEAEPGWRSFLVRDMYDLQALAESFEGPRAGFDPSSERFRQVFCRLEEQPQQA